MLKQEHPNQTMKKLTALLTLVGTAIGASALAAEIDWSKLPAASAKTGVTFANDIAPIFKDSCVRCHGADRPKAQLRLDTLEGVLKGTKEGPILKAGDSANSLLVKSVSQLDPQTAMPPKPRARRGPGGPQGTNAPNMQPRDGGPLGGGPGGGDRPRVGGEGGRPPGGPEGTNAPGQRPRNSGPQAKPLTAEQVGLVRAWIDQGAK
jgi:mono/diheme cytochrome c family protein